MGRIAGTDSFEAAVANNLTEIARKRMDQYSFVNPSVSVSVPRGYSEELDQAAIDLARVNPRRF